VIHAPELEECGDERCVLAGRGSVRAAGAVFADDTRGKPRVDDRRVISGIVHVLKSGGRWIDAPPVYGPRKTLYNRFVRWAAKGVWTNIFQALAASGGPPTQLLIDPPAVKAHRSAAGGKGGRSTRRSAVRVAGTRRKSTPSRTRSVTRSPSS
jgi:transposase